MTFLVNRSACLDALNIFRLGLSWGGVNALAVVYPDLVRPGRDYAGRLVRLNVGLEETRDPLRTSTTRCARRASRLDDGQLWCRGQQLRTAARTTNSPRAPCTWSPNGQFERRHHVFLNHRMIGIGV